MRAKWKASSVLKTTPAKCLKVLNAVSACQISTRDRPAIRLRGMKFKRKRGNWNREEKGIKRMNREEQGIKHLNSEALLFPFFDFMPFVFFILSLFLPLFPFSSLF